MIITLVRNDGEPTPEYPGEQIWRGGYQGPSIDDADQLPASLLSNRISDLQERIEIGTWYPVERFKDLFSASRNDAGAWSEVAVPVLTPDGKKDNVLIQVELNSCCDMMVQAVFDLTEQLDLWRQKGSIWIRVE